MKVLGVLLAMALSLFANEAVVKSILDNVLIKNINQAVQSSHELKSELKEKNEDKIRAKFIDLMQNWKKVEATYIGGDLEDDLLDLPRYIDTYHEGNENIHEQLTRIINSKESLDVALFKNSHKTINALEFVLYKDKMLNKRELEIAKRINQSIYENLEQIAQAYKKDAPKMLKDESFANSAILNALVSSSYKNAMWRVGESIGEGKKYNGKDLRRSEYSLSKLSIKALHASIYAHQEIMDGKYDDFGDMAARNGAKKEVVKIRDLLKNSLALTQNMQDEELLGKKGEELFKMLKTIYINYGLYMVDDLSITAKIIDADGD